MRWRADDYRALPGQPVGLACLDTLPADKLRAFAYQHGASVHASARTLAGYALFRARWLEATARGDHAAAADFIARAEAQYYALPLEMRW